MEVMATLQASLPSQHRSAISLEVQAEAYWRMLGKHTAEQIEFLRVEAIRRLRWFPTIAECLSILSEREAANPLLAKRDRVKALIQREKVARFNDWIDAFKRGEVTQESVDAAPPRWRLIAVERGFLRVMDDGTFTIRPLPEPVPDETEEAA